jgi:fructose/tagatose bisphosphate aldolase
LPQQVQKRPLYIHRGSGGSAELLRKAISCGIRKVNFGTELKKAFHQSSKAFAFLLVTTSI